MKYLTGILIAIALTACGGSDAYNSSGGGSGGGGAYTFVDAQKDCGQCHSSSSFMVSASAFKADEQAYNYVVSGKMPKGNPYSQDRIKAFAAWFHGS